MLLSKGITGFYAHNDEAPEEVGAKFFKKACYVMDAYGFPIITMCCPVNNSYFEAQIIVDDKPLYILMNKYYPLFAFCEDPRTPDKKFTDIINEPLSGMGYKVAISVELDAPFDHTNHELSTTELDQIDYYKPKKVGDIIFNEWD